MAKFPDHNNVAELSLSNPTTMEGNLFGALNLYLIFKPIIYRMNWANASKSQ